MAEIYSAADVVAIWLGAADQLGRTDRAMDFITRTVKERGLETLITDEFAQHWSDLIYLMRSSWFSRRWVIQELALAKEATVYCGARKVHWRDFSDAISLFVLHFEEIRQLFESRLEFRKDYYAITELDPLGAKILVDEISNIFLKNSNGTLLEPLKNLESLVSTLAPFNTSGPRDTIHCLLNMAKETSSKSSLASTYAHSPNPPPVPSYGKDLLEVYTGFVKWVVAESGSLDIICRQWAVPEREKRTAGYEKLVKLPSWIRTVIDSPWGRGEEGFHGRKNGDSFVGLPGTHIYNASRGLKPQVIYGLFKETQERVEINDLNSRPRARAPLLRHRLI